jgi:transcriptional regulator with XRE-family HTH domain
MGTEQAKRVGERLAMTRRALGYASAADFVRVFNTSFKMTQQRWSNYETGDHLPPPEVALAICDRFDLTTDWIYRGVRSGLPAVIKAAIEAQELNDHGASR